MNLLLTLIGILVIAFGVIIWRLQLVEWPSNVPKGGGIMDKKKAASLAGAYLS